ncbi:MAG: pantetheine-phosphate adenylyltransferase [Bacteroidales bacterium]|nr:pantetheine-phosphate adenylyltransferase [Bacteroidales bacterium]
MKRALFTGSFNPFTIGHLDILKRGLRLFDEVVVGLGCNYDKHGLTPEIAHQQLEYLRQLLAPLERVKVIIFSSLAVEAARHHDAQWLLRGARSVADFEYERRMADINHELAPEIDTVLLMARPELAMVSSSMIRELQHYGVDTSRWLPQPSSITTLD